MKLFKAFYITVLSSILNMGAQMSAANGVDRTSVQSINVVTQDFTHKGCGIDNPEELTIWNFSNTQALTRDETFSAPRFKITDGNILSESINNRRLDYFLTEDGLRWIGEQTSQMKVICDSAVYTVAWPLSDTPRHDETSVYDYTTHGIYSGSMYIGEQGSIYSRSALKGHIVLYNDTVPAMMSVERRVLNRTDDVMQELAYWYEYDSRGLCTLKKLPGVCEQHLLYDPAGRLAAYNHDDESSWMLLYYDDLGRQVALINSSITAYEAEDFASAVRVASLTPTNIEQGDLGGYLVSPAPTVPYGNAIWSRFYDDYVWKTIRDVSSAFNATVSPADATGLVTGLYTGQGHEVYYYDDRGQEIEKFGTGYNTGRRISNYNYDGTVSSQSFSYTQNYLPPMTKSYTYDRIGRMTTSTINASSLGMGSNLPVILNSSEAMGLTPGTNEHVITDPMPELTKLGTAFVTRQYDAIGRLSSIKHGPNISTEYTYDVRGWLTNQSAGRTSGLNNNDIASYSLTYTNNGNILSRSWDEGSYTYSYDNLNRLTSAAFTPTQGQTGTVNNTNFSTEYTYDERGNMLTLSRQGITDIVTNPRTGAVTETFGNLDILNMSYTGNKLTGFTAQSDAMPFDGVRGVAMNGSATLTYDTHGRLKSDTSRGLLRTYYDVNGYVNRQDLSYGHQHLHVHDGLGNHLSTSFNVSVKPVTGATTLPGRTRRVSLRSYTGDGHVMRTSNAIASVGDTLEILRWDGGYFTSDGKAHYTVSDYLGSTIAVVKADGSVEQRTSYYPYGEPHRDPYASASSLTEAKPNRYLFGGKQYMTQDGLKYYNFEARDLLSTIGRFATPDPKSDTYPGISHYLFCAANPINATDPTGEDIVVLIWYNNIFQHLAMLIQNDNGKWQYYSVNGDNLAVSGSHIGGRKFNDVGVGSWDSPQDFFNSSYNVRDDNSKDDKSKNNYGYIGGYQIPTTPEQDATMRSSFAKTAKTEYKLFSNNCATAVQRAMLDAGIPVSENSIVPTYIPVSTPFGLVNAVNGYTINYDMKILPTFALNNIIKSNPSGHVVYKNNLIN